jgi:hypothetical protein
MAVLHRLSAGRARRLAPKVARAADPSTSRRALYALAVFSSRRTPVARALAGNPSTPSLCLRVLAHGPWDVAAAVAGNASTPQGVLARSFMHRPAWAVRSALAANTAAPSKALQQLASGKEFAVRLRVAASPLLPSETVGALLRDTSPYVRAVAAGNPHAGAAALEQLARPMTEPAWVLRAVASNSSCPPALADEILTWIAHGGEGGAGNSDPTFDPLTCTGHPGDTTLDVEDWYRQIAIKTAAEGAEIHPLWRVRSSLTSSWARIGGDALITLAIDPQPEVRLSMAQSLSMTQLRGVTFARLKHLARDADPQVAAAAVRAIKQKRKTTPIWRWYAVRRLIMVPLVLGLLALAAIIGSHVGSSNAPAPREVTAHWSGPTDNGLPQQLPGDGQVLAEPLDAQGASRLTISTGSIPFDFDFPFTVLNVFGTPLGTEFQLGRYSSVTVIVNPPASPVHVLVTTSDSGNVVTTDLPIIYAEFSAPQAAAVMGQGDRNTRTQHSTRVSAQHQ